MITIHICEYLAEKLARYFPGAEIYSNIDPTREYSGGLMVEIGEPEEPETLTFLSGSTQTKRGFIVAIRAPTLSTARDALEIVHDPITETLNAIPCYAWNFEAVGWAPDVRGVVSGESFYAYLEFTIIERQI